MHVGLILMVSLVLFSGGNAVSPPGKFLIKHQHQIPNQLQGVCMATGIFVVPGSGVLCCARHHSKVTGMPGTRNI